MQWIQWFGELTIADVPRVGGKNASLGEMIRELSPKGIQIPDGFALTADAYRAFLHYNELEGRIQDILKGLDTHDVNDLLRRTAQIRRLILLGEFPPDMHEEVFACYDELSTRYGQLATDVAVRSSATAEDLPTASFAGQQETYLNVHGEAMLLESVTKCFASLFTPRATSYRVDLGFGHFDVALSVGIQKMVRSDLASSGVIFTLDTESGFRDVVFVTSAYGLGENIVQGRIAPDEFYVFKPTLRQGYKPLIWRRLGTKELRMVYDEAGSKLVKNINVTKEDRGKFSVSDDDVLTLAKWAMLIEDHYTAKRCVDCPMDIEWAKDGKTGELFIVQARPETVHSQRVVSTIRTYRLKGQGRCAGQGSGRGRQDRIRQGPRDPQCVTYPRVPAGRNPGHRYHRPRLGTDHEDGRRHRDQPRRAHEPCRHRLARAGHPGHRRQLATPPRSLSSGQAVTVSCAEGEVGRIYAGELPFEVQTVDVSELARPHTKIMMNVGSPDAAFKHAAIPNDGVGLRAYGVYLRQLGAGPSTGPDALRRHARRRARQG